MRHLEASFDSAGLSCAATIYRQSGSAGLAGCVVMGNGVTLTRTDGIPDYAQRIAELGFVVVAFDYRCWGDSGGEPRRWVSIRNQLEDWRAAVACARGLDGVDPDRIAVWGMSLGGGLALRTAAADSRIAAAIALVPMADGLAFLLRPAPPSVTMRMMWCTMRGALTRSAVTVPVAGPPRSFALLAAPEALAGFERVAGVNGWRNEADIRGLLLSGARFRPVRDAAAIRSPVLVQLGQRDGMVPLRPIEKVAMRARDAELVRYPIDHFGCYAPEHIDSVAGDELEFLRRHVLRQGATSESAAWPDNRDPV